MDREFEEKTKAFEAEKSACTNSEGSAEKEKAGERKDTEEKSAHNEKEVIIQHESTTASQLHEFSSLSEDEQIHTFLSWLKIDNKTIEKIKSETTKLTIKHVRDLKMENIPEDYRKMNFDVQFLRKYCSVNAFKHLRSVLQQL